MPWSIFLARQPTSWATDVATVSSSSGSLSLLRPSGAASAAGAVLVDSANAVAASAPMPATRSRPRREGAVVSESGERCGAAALSRAVRGVFTWVTLRTSR
ncbi:hypothetical protein D3C74_349060 [compost metagenome]